jgi:hypothetical protein
MVLQKMISEFNLVVITIVKDDAVGFGMTLKSVEMQTQKTKHIVIDGSSVESNQDLISKMCAIAGSVYFHQHAQGIYPAMNFGLSKCDEHELVVFLNAGDCFFSPGSVKQIQTDRFVSGRPFFIYPCVFGRENTFMPSIQDVTARTVAMAKALVCHQGVVVSAGLMRSVGSFDETYKISADHKLLLQLLQISEPSVGTTPIAIVELGGISDQSCSKLVRENERARHETGMSSNFRIADKSLTIRRLIRCQVKLLLRRILKKLRIPYSLPQQIIHKIR